MVVLATIVSRFPLLTLRTTVAAAPAHARAQNSNADGEEDESSTFAEYTREVMRRSVAQVMKAGGSNFHMVLTRCYRRRGTDLGRVACALYAQIRVTSPTCPYRAPSTCVCVCACVCELRGGRDRAISSRCEVTRIGDCTGGKLRSIKKRL